ncbi:MAG TPA: ComEC/Rec2 family competence protein [Hypericibacter adhaerens]|uniref:Competence protein ComEC n=1 Tax=Hypericibacter adhaerens TaxID=2602016 RepID=A0A5J6MZJ4_9PROT|nr:ComEC/Rec2 family competence protein [Hypericibacter adhaerens]QEX22323.1 competence protein ComEC [Hypericibacter adhaerens]HWA46037.1 ComEC/Rec2 family competence protein [Hypericibacter adhaerens]
MSGTALTIPTLGLGRIGLRLGRWFAAERDQWLLWAPVALGTGVAVYFGLREEPPLWLGPGLAVLGILLCLLCRRQPGLMGLAAAMTLVALGFGAAGLRTAWVAAPILERDIGPVRIAGRILDIEPLPSGQRLVLADPVIAGIAPDATPARLRIKLMRETPGLTPGDRVSLLGKLSPPAPPFAPGGFDFQRDAFFNGIGAIGFAFGGAEVETPGEIAAGRLDTVIADIRAAISARILAVLPDQEGAMAVALVTGTQTAIDKPVMTAMRDSGLAHLLSISGLHVGFVAAILFFCTRALMALWPSLALRHPIKKWAALAAILGAGFYTLLAGSPIPTQRAFLMTGLVLLAVLVDRVAFSMRLIAWAAFVVLLIRPDAMIGPSFQMSFAAVMALIAAYEGSREWRAGLRADAGPIRRTSLYLGGLVATSLIAGAATAPFAIYHFNRFSEYSVLANLMAIPLTGFWVMPWAVAACLLMPFGLEALALVPMGWGIDGIIWIAQTVAALPGAVLMLPAMPLAGLIMVTLGGLWLCLWHRPWRYAGIVPILAGMATMLLTQTPDILVAEDGKLLAVKAPDGELVLNTQRSSLAAETWLRRAGQSESDRWPGQGAGAGGRLACDPLGCLYRNEGHLVALAWSTEALPEDCNRADLVIALEPVRTPCPSAGRVIDRFDLWRQGGHAIWLEPGAVEVETVAESRGNRPWVARPLTDGDSATDEEN